MNPVTPESIRKALVSIALVGIAVLIGFLSWRITSVTKERDAALVTVGVQKKSLDDVTGANLALQDTINELVAKQKSDEATRKRIEEQVEQVNKAIQSQRRELRKLGETNATVRSYLDTPVPPELRSLYNKADAAANASGSNKNLVPATPGQAGGASSPAANKADQSKR